LTLLSSQVGGGLSGDVRPVQTALCSPHKSSQERGAFLSGRTVKQESPPMLCGLGGDASQADSASARNKQVNPLHDFISKPPFGQASPEENPLVGVGAEKSHKDDCDGL